MEQLNEEQSAGVMGLNWFKWLFFVALLLVAYLIYSHYQRSKEAERLFQAKSKELNAAIESLQRDKSRLESEVAGQKNKLAGYAAYLPLIYNLKLVDTAYRSLPFRYGQHVRTMPDSADGVVNSIVITANELEYSVRYLVRNKKGELVALSVSDIMSSETK
ncbi:MAG: hypothetical protein ACKO6Q_03870 [Bacteroidota bacterium]